MAAASLALRVSPTGKLHLDGPASDGASGVGERIRRALSAGDGAGLLHLGAVEVTSALPPSLSFFRDLSRLFMTRLCGAPYLSSQRERVELDAPGEELASLARAVPPMEGAEYVDVALLARFWDAIDAAFRDELRGFDGPVEAWLLSKNPAWNTVGRVHFHLAENKRDPARPFAFLATYATALSAQARVQHAPLGQALAGVRRRDERRAAVTCSSRCSARPRRVRSCASSSTPGEISPARVVAGRGLRFLQRDPAPSRRAA